MLSFRDVERKFVIINTSRFLVLTGNKCNANSLLCYAYVDHVAGLTYETVAAAMYVDGDFSVVDTVQTVSGKIRAGAVKDDEIVPLNNKALLSQYAYIVENIDKFYYRDSKVEDCRSITELDIFRHKEFPDDVQVLFYKEGVRPEGIWVRVSELCERRDGVNLFMGVLLNTPHADFGVVENDTVLFAVSTMENSTLCFAVLK